jgi:two-component system NtrC family response regulator
VKPRIAIVDDEPRMGKILSMVLAREGHAVTPFTRPADFLEVVQDFDLLLTDLKMPEMDGVALLTAARAAHPDLSVILMTAYGTVQTAVAAMKQGASDYLIKPIDNTRCRAAVARALQTSRLARENRHLRAQLLDQSEATVVAQSESMVAVLALARRAAASTSTILILGESGTGKEVLARTIHIHSDRIAGPFVAVNCKSLAAGLLESELFGHDRGAFTGALTARPGLFERASGGTLLLDEIGEIDADFQGRLLRVIQERVVRRVGGQAEIPVDVRIVAATNRDLAAEVAAGRFRSDLYFRLNVIPITLPPLRDRPADILPLAHTFLHQLATRLSRRFVGFTPAVERWMLAHDWPGNVRELQNAVERGAVLAREERIDLPDLMLPAGAETAGTLQACLDRTAADHIRQTLARCGGVRVEAATMLGIERTTLYRLMKKYGIS